MRKTLLGLGLVLSLVAAPNQLRACDNFCGFPTVTRCDWEDMDNNGFDDTLTTVDVFHAADRCMVCLGGSNAGALCQSSGECDSGITCGKDGIVTICGG